MNIIFYYFFILSKRPESQLKSEPIASIKTVYIAAFPSNNNVRQQFHLRHFFLMPPTNMAHNITPFGANHPTSKLDCYFDATNLITNAIQLSMLFLCNQAQ